MILGITRRAFWPLVLIGLIGGVAVAGRAEVTYDSTGEVIRGVISPLAGLALALVSRLLVAVVGLIAAYPLGHDSALAVDPHPIGRRGMIGRTIDRIHVTRALRELRATRAVQHEAASRLEPRGRVLACLDDAVRRSLLPLVGLLVLVAVGRSL